MDPSNLLCQLCGNIGLYKCDGFFFCCKCHSMAEDFIDTDVADEDIAPGGIYLPRHTRRRPHVIEAAPTCQHDPLYDSQPKLFKALGLENRAPQQTDDAPSVPTYLGSLTSVKALSYDDYHNAVRIRYLLGLQIMLRLQCETLIDKFGVNSLIRDSIKRNWLSYILSTNVLGLDWPYVVISEAKLQQAPGTSYYNQCCVNVWYRYLKNTIPIKSTLAILFLACHEVREAVLPTDIAKWADESKLPYLAAFDEIEKSIGSPDRACPISSMEMFNPSPGVSPQEIESFAARIVDSLGLEIPPVNFFEIANRYLQQLNLPHDKILSKAMKIYEWSMPPGLWLSTKDSRFPSRLYILSILIVTIRMLYNINGFGYWEKSLSNSNAVTLLKYKGKGAIDSNHNEEDATKLLCHLHSLCIGLPDKYEREYAKKLQSYLKHCKDNVFAGLEPHYVQKRMIEDSWNYYQNCYQDGMDPFEQEAPSTSWLKENKPRDEGCSSRTSKEKDEMTQKCFNSRRNLDDHMNSLELEQETKTNGTQGNEALRILMLDMKEKRFQYIPPRQKIKNSDYIHYGRKKDDGALAYVADSDYYIILRACAKLAQVDTRIMYMAVLNFENRLNWIEDKIESTLHEEPEKIECERCKCGTDKT